MSRVMIVCHPLAMGGTEKTVVNLGNYLCKDNAVTIVVISRKNKLPESFIKPSKKIDQLNLVHNSSLPSYVALLFELRRVMSKKKIETVISFLTVPSVLVLLASIFSSAKVIVSERTDPIRTPGLSMTWKILRYLTYSFLLRRLVVQNDAIGDEFSYVDARLRTVIPNAGSPSELKWPDLRGDIKPVGAGLNLLFVGRLEYQKGIDILVETVIIYHQDYLKKGITLTIVGDGILMNDIKHSINKNFLGTSVFLKGAIQTQSGIRECMSRADYVVLPSRWEGLPNVLVESFQAGTPVIATETAGAGYVVDEVNGLLIKELTPKALNDAITRALALKGNSLAMRKASYEASREFEPQKIYSKWQKLLE